MHDYSLFLAVFCLEIVQIFHSLHFSSIILVSPESLELRPADRSTRSHILSEWQQVTYPGADPRQCSFRDSSCYEILLSHARPCSRKLILLSVKFHLYITSLFRLFSDVFQSVNFFFRLFSLCTFRVKYGILFLNEKRWIDMPTYTGDMIRKYRTEKGLTQKKLGELCGIADSNIRKYESVIKTLK